MDKLNNLMNNIMSTNSSNEKKEIFINFFKNITKDEMNIYLRFLSNTILPEPQKLNIGDATLIATVSNMTGFTKEEIKKMKKQYGNVSQAIEYCFNNNKTSEMSLNDFFAVEEDENSSKLMINDILYNLEILSTKTTLNDKTYILESIMTDQEPETIKYLSHFILGGTDLSVGYKNKLLLDAIAQFYNRPIDDILEAYTFTNSIPNLINVDFDTDWTLQMHFPYKPELADKTNKPIVPNGQHIDIKYDGGRIQIHASKEKISLFTRNIENVTNSFPDIYIPLQNWVKETSHEVILDSEFIVGENFNDFLNRIRRIHNIEEYANELPAMPKIFDILYIDGKDLRKLNRSERMKYLYPLELPENFEKVEYEIFTDQTQLDKLFEKAISEGFEGIMVKKDAPYELNNRSETWTKVKPSYSVDLQIVDAKFGTGRHANKYSSFTLATDEGLTIGNVGIGLTDEFINELNELYPNKIILEIEYESVQKTDKYTSGYSLRFPRVKSIRYDKNDVSTLKEVLKGVNIT